MKILKVLKLVLFPGGSYSDGLILQSFIGSWSGLITGALFKYKYLGFLGWWFVFLLSVLFLAFVVRLAYAYLIRRKRLTEIKRAFNEGRGVVNGEVVEAGAVVDYYPFAIRSNCGKDCQPC